ncbi:autoinducer binding domain-containing protein, partial [Serratia sp. CY68758]|uniref:autoinducer binding domain-containing protein n=1 Tax=Serratia sp. CY68758 TaxID=3383667 RepID=UPI003F9F1F39
ERPLLWRHMAQFGLCAGWSQSVKDCYGRLGILTFAGKATMRANRGSVSVTLSNCLSLAVPSQNMSSVCNYQERLSAVDKSKAIMSEVNKLKCPAPVKISAEASLKL